METAKLYGGKVVLEFDPGRHLYFANGKKVDLSVSGITKILDKPALVFWAAKMCAEFFTSNLPRLKDCMVMDQRGDEICVEFDEVAIASFVKDMKRWHGGVKERAGTIGTVAHDYAEARIKNILDPSKPKPQMPVNEAARNSIRAFLDWEKEHKVSYLFSERKIFSVKHNYAGTCDVGLIIDGRRCLADFKTSSGIWTEQVFQIAGYDIALVEEGDPAYEERWILRLDKNTGEFESKKFTGDQDARAFLACLEVARIMKEFYPQKHEGD